MSGPQPALSRPRVVHFTTVHRPDDVRIFRKECRTLAAAGYDVVLVAPGAPDLTVEGVRYHPISPMPNRFLRLLSGGWKAFSAARAERAAIYHFHDPELLPVGLLLRMIGKRVIWDVHEDVPGQVLSKYWIPPLLRRPVAWLVNGIQRVSVRAFSGVVAAGNDIADLLGGRGITVLRNFPMLEEFEGSTGRLYEERPPLLLHVGNLGRIRATRELVSALDLIPDRYGIELVLAGSFVDDGVEAETRALPGWARVRYWGWSSRAQIANGLARGRAGVVLLYPEPNHMQVRSNRLFEYLAAGLPVVASDLPAWRAIVSELDCGVLVNPLDPQSIANGIMWLLDHPAEAERMGERGRRAVLERFNWQEESQGLLHLYHRILSPESPNTHEVRPE